MESQRGDTISINTMFRQYEAQSLTPLVEVVSRGKREIFLCESCLSFFSVHSDLEMHIETCPHVFWIPGDEIYRCPTRRFVVIEIDGRKPVCGAYTKRIAQLAKMFLDEKTTLGDLHFFAFVTIFELDEYGYHFAGYFSKEWRKTVSCGNTLSCLMVLPPYRSKGYGSFLVEMSYEMSRIEGVPGTPERPLSSEGKRMFDRIWREELLRAVSSVDSKKGSVTLKSLSTETGMSVEDVAVALHRLGVVFYLAGHNPLILMPGEVTDAARRAKRLDANSLVWVSLF
uniref:histone acetyltransferase n=1 Tax=Trypanosoma congolense (strain IL3000) TaxID=1068625 RepID=G0UX27_TRYCI|nr:putative acetyltransferase [Trypanosoma congolense IL3000]